MNICLISKEYPPETGWGGIGTYTHSLAHGLAENGQGVYVLSYATGEERVYKDGKVTVHRVKPKGMRGMWWLNSFLPVSPVLYSRRIAARLTDLVSTCKIDIVETPEWQAEIFWYLFQKKIPVVLRFHTPKFLTQKLNCASGNLGDAWIRWLEKYCALHADYLTAPSRAMSEIVAKEYSLEKGTIRVIANPIDTTFFTPKVNKQEELIVLYTGRLERRKGAHILAKAIPLVLSHIPHAIFVFIGEDTNSSPCHLSMKDYIREQSVGSQNVVFMEHMQRQCLVEYYQKSCVCVVPSVWEAFGYTCVEAMSCGKPVIASGSGGLAEIIEDGHNGILVPPESPEWLAGAIVRLLKDVDLREKIGGNARKTVEQKFSTIVIAKRMAELYTDILARFRSWQ